MPSLAQLQAEPWWRREVITAELAWLGDELCRRTNRPRSAWGDKGNEAHLNGGHRSQEWILNSDWCNNSSYTVQSGLSAEQLRHIGAGDFTPETWGSATNRALMVTHTGNLFAAARAGRLTGLRQIFGTLDGRRPIGLNVLSNSTTVPDDSHLDHLHFTFDRRYLRDAALMARIADIVTGDDMTPEQQASLENVNYATFALISDLPSYPAFPDNDPKSAKLPVKNKVHDRLEALAAGLAGVQASVDGIAVPAPAPVDIDALAAKLAPMVELAAERAVRRVLGAVDGATPKP